jgi:uncharacterized protein YbdZ (MbtH family)
MGLDQYLYKKTYVQNWSHMRPEQLHEITVTRGGKPTAIKPARIKEITEQVGYWRKANQIHAWFVEHVQAGKDDCMDYYVNRQQLEELLDVVNTVLTDHAKAPELLPPQAGFFFGSTDYDEWYFKDLEQTKEIIEGALAENGDGEFYYSSSW